MAQVQSWRNHSRMWIAAGVLTAMLGTWTALRLHRASDVSVTTATVTTGPVARRIVATGTLQPTATVQVGAQVSGTIEELYADYNAIVRKGQMIAKLDPALLDAALRESQAAFAQAQAALAQAQADQAGLATAVDDARTKLTRAEELASRQILATSDLDAARAVMGEAAADLRSGESRTAQARAAVEQARAVVGQAQVNVDRTIIRSPIDGIVVSRNVDIGQTVAATLQAPVLFSIAADFRHMQVEVDIDEADIGGLRPGEPATFQVESYPEQTFQGAVSQIRLQPVAQETTTAATVGVPAPSSTTIASVISYATIVEVENPDEKLRPGMTATVVLNGTRVDHAVLLPNAALSFRPPQSVLDALKQTLDVPPTAQAGDSALRRVWKFDGAKFTPIDLRAGVTDGQWTQVISGPLQDGDVLVTSASVGRSGRAQNAAR